MAVPKLPLLAADTNFLIDLEDGANFALEGLEVLKRRLVGHVMYVPPTVITELAYGVENWEGDRRRLAVCALQNMKPKWGFQPSEFIPVGHGIVEITALHLIAEGLIPKEEQNDAFILAESALLKAQILITSDRHLTGVDPGKLRAILESRDLCPVLIQAPRSIAQKFGGKR